MAPEIEIPINMDAINEADINQTYMLMFQKLKNDFVTKRDFEIMMAGATAPPPFKLVFVPTYLYGEALAGVYLGATKTGDAVRKTTVEIAEAIV